MSKKQERCQRLVAMIEMVERQERKSTSGATFSQEQVDELKASITAILKLDNIAPCR